MIHGGFYRPHFHGGAEQGRPKLTKPVGRTLRRISSYMRPHWHLGLMVVLLLVAFGFLQAYSGPTDSSGH